MNKMLTVGAAALCVFAAGCTDLKPLQSQVDDLKSQVSKLSAAHSSMKSAVDSAARAAQAAQAAADKAQGRADAAYALAQDDKTRIDGLEAKLTEKITKAFKKSHEK
jgi:outer membrane murein-binding lipoprotein Lpp